MFIIQLVRLLKGEFFGLLRKKDQVGSQLGRCSGLIYTNAGLAS